MVRSRAAEQRRTPKRGRDSGRGNFACVLECGGVPPLFDATEKPGTFVTVSICPKGLAFPLATYEFPVPRAIHHGGQASGTRRWESGKTRNFPRSGDKATLNNGICAK